jgi:hypothetical protein
VFNVGPERLILLFVIILVVMGPQRLPELARTLGRTMAGLRRLSGNLQAEMHGALDGDPIVKAVGTIREGVGTFRDGLGDVLAPPGPRATRGSAPLLESLSDEHPIVPSTHSRAAGLPDDPGLN